MKLRVATSSLAAIALGCCVCVPLAAAEPTACALVPDDEAKAFAGADFDRDADSPTSCTIDTMKDGFYNRYLFVTLEQYEPLAGMTVQMPDLVKDMVEQSSANEQSSGGKKLACKVAGPAHFACLDVASPAGSFKPDQRAALVLFGKGNAFVRITVFHDERPNLQVGTELAARIYARLP